MISIQVKWHWSLPIAFDLSTQEKIQDMPLFYMADWKKKSIFHFSPPKKSVVLQVISIVL